MKNISLWNDLVSKKAKELKGDISVDVLIIGGGMSGISTLYHLKDSGLKTILVERNVCGRGVTSRSTAKITFLQEKMYMKIRNFVSEEEAKKYLNSQIEAVNLLKNIILENDVDCDLEQADSYIFTNRAANINKIKQEYEFLKSAGVDCDITETLPLPLKGKSALKVKGTYVFHPLKYIDAMKKKFLKNIYENTKVHEIEKEGDYYVSKGEGFNIKSKYVVIATHYPYFLSPFLAPLKSHVETSYLGATKVKMTQKYSTINIDKPCISLRYHDDGIEKYMVFLYSSYASCNVPNIKRSFDQLTNKYKMEYIWSNKDIITNDYLPYVGSATNDGTFLIATGYNTWGMTNGTLAGKILSDIITGRPNEYIDLFSLKRQANLSKLVRFPLDLSCNAKAFLKSNRFNSNNTQVDYRVVDGKRVMVYIDEIGQEHMVLNKCPHMKCGLIFNEVEKTWDCLCHGSRFDIDGKCIEGPSNYDISFKPNEK